MTRVGTGLVQLWWAEYFFFGLVWLKRFGCLVAVWLKFGSTSEHTSPSNLENLKRIWLKYGVKHTYLPFYTNLVAFKKMVPIYSTHWPCFSYNLPLLVTTKLQPNSTDLPNIFPLWFGGPNILYPLQPVPTLLKYDASLMSVKQRRPSPRNIINNVFLLMTTRDEGGS